MVPGDSGSVQGDLGMVQVVSGFFLRILGKIWGFTRDFGESFKGYGGVPRGTLAFSKGYGEAPRGIL